MLEQLAKALKVNADLYYLTGRMLPRPDDGVHKAGRGDGLERLSHGSKGEEKP